LYELTDDAIARAQVLKERIRRDELDEFNNPSTGIDELVTHLMGTYKIPV